MTGFARVQGRTGAWSWTWELKTVNARGLDIRLRTPPGFDAFDQAWRAALSTGLERGTCHANLSAVRDAARVDLQVDVPALQALINSLDGIVLPAHIKPASLDGLLAVRGIVEAREASESEDDRSALHSAVTAGLSEAMQILVATRREEGAALGAVLSARIERIGALTAQAEATPGRSAAAVEARLSAQIAALGQSHGLDSARLHQEAVLLAAKSDIREELDRLVAHVDSVRALLKKGGPVGRRLDFLAQELGRESNTLCAKSNDPTLTAIGLDLKIEVEQFREQLQNIE